jgi:hypothetical protein
LTRHPETVEDATVSNGFCLPAFPPAREIVATAGGDAVERGDGVIRQIKLGRRQVFAQMRDGDRRLQAQKGIWVGGPVPLGYAAVAKGIAVEVARLWVAVEARAGLGLFPRAAAKLRPLAALV